MIKTWDYRFNSSDGPSTFNSLCVADEMDIIELGYGVMFGTACENDYDSEFTQEIIKERAIRATELHWSKYS